MPKIYLASDSAARRKLLKFMGLKFKVMPSRAEELKYAPGKPYSWIVKQNALAKASRVAEKVKSGVVIGADTIVVQGGRAFGKPAGLKAARRMLKILSCRPQWIYTGLAVIDKDKGRLRSACEKTKVYMDRMSGREISAYFKRASPLGKAGSFDIQESGAFFIRRIEGCYYNVVGLPLRLLYRMLKSLGVKIFPVIFYLSLPAAAFLSGCSTEYNLATRQEESYLYNYTTDKEVVMGRNIAQQINAQEKMVDDPLIQKRVEDLGKKIAAICDRKEIDYHFIVLADEQINAFSLPGGWVYVNKGLVDKAANDDELAGVIGHEIGHIVARHSIKKLQALAGYSLLSAAAAAAPVGGDIKGAADLAFADILYGYGRDDELLADQLGVRYMKASGYNPKSMIDFLQRLQDVNRRRPLQAKTYFKTHPYVPDRIRIVKQELGQNMNFNDYINIEQKKQSISLSNEE